MKVLFINPPWYRLQGLISTYPPMGALYIAAVLEQNGYVCRVWNADYSSRAEGVSEGSSTIKMKEMSHKYSRYLATLNDLHHPIWKEVEQIIKQQSPDVIGLLTCTSSLGSVKNVARIAKQINPAIKIICGGPHATIQPEDIISDENVDFVVQGEGEYITLDILQHIDDFQALEKIKGITFKHDGDVICTGKNETPIDLSTLPLPAKHLLLDKEKMPSVVFQPIFTSRGCPHRCIYCSSHKIHGYKTRLVPIETTLKEIRLLKKDFNVHHFFICDDTFGQNRRHTENFLNAILSEKLNITWGCQTRGERIAEDLVKLMKKSGCTQVSIGVETGSPRIRKMIKKGNTVDDILSAARLLKKYKIEMAAFFMFGFPDETAEDIQMTIDLFEQLKPYTAHCNIATPDPGTEMLEMVQRKGRFNNIDDWNTFFHQNPDLFHIEQMEKKAAFALVGKLQSKFDAHNKKMQRLDVVKRFPLYVSNIIKGRLYRNPRYLMNKAKDLI